MSEQTASSEATIERSYTLRNRTEVLRFVQEHPLLVRLLLDACGAIQKHFPGSQAFLEVLTNPEAIDDQELVVSVATDLPPAEAVPKLERFDSDWWLDSLDRAQGKLCITLEFR